jgi:hypothetical protein
VNPNLDPDFDLWSLLKNAWVAIAALAGFIFKRHLDEDAERAKQLALVQQTYATRDQMEKLTKTVSENHQEILKLLLRD